MKILISSLSISILWPKLTIWEGGGKERTISHIERKGEYDDSEEETRSVLACLHRFIRIVSCFAWYRRRDNLVKNEDSCIYNVKTYGEDLKCKYDKSSLKRKREMSRMCLNVKLYENEKRNIYERKGKIHTAGCIYNLFIFTNERSKPQKCVKEKGRKGRRPSSYEGKEKDPMKKIHICLLCEPLSRSTSLCALVSSMCTCNKWQVWHVCSPIDGMCERGRTVTVVASCSVKEERRPLHDMCMTPSYVSGKRV